MDVGPLFVSAPFAYRARKKRAAGTSRRRRVAVSEVLLARGLFHFFFIVPPEVLRHGIETDPAPYFMIPVWALTAYFCAGARRLESA